ncbi:MAG: pyruvate kinase [Patescibacteria group bacterium]
MKRTKIVATIGPASQTKIIMEKMIKAGLNVARLNFSHGSYKHHRLLIGNLRSVAKSLKSQLAIIQDLQGPRIRIGEVGQAGLKVSRGQEVFLVPPKRQVSSQSAVVVPIQYKELYRDLKAGQPVLIDDATIELSVTKIKNDTIVCKVITGGIIKSHKGMNFPKSLIKCPPLTKKDLADVDFGVKNKVDFIALSFVKDAKDIVNLRKKIFALEKKYYPAGSSKTSGAHTKLIAKIERREAVKNFSQILAAADAIMIARGDLGIELPFEDLPLIQKKIIDECRQAGKPVIVATQMLDSMIRNPLPTRAEVSDVANAVLDGTDAIMLSGETATGQYPLRAVAAMSRIAKEIEAREIEEQEAKENKYKNQSLNKIMSFVAQDLAEDLTKVKLIACATVSGATARNISSFRPKAIIIALTPSVFTANQLSLSWGVSAFVLPLVNSFEALIAKIKTLVQTAKLAKKSETIIIVTGHPFGRQGKTNLVKVETV